MVWELVAAHVALPSAVAAAAGFGAWRCRQLLRLAFDARLQKLMWFYGLFAASLIPMAIWTGQLAATVSGTLPSASLFEASGAWHDAFAGAERVDALLAAHHALMLASLAVAVLAFRQRSAGSVVAAVGIALLGPLVLGALAAEAAMTLYLAVHAVRNHARRRSPGALQVAAGFLLFFLGHLSFLVFYHPVAVRTPLGDVLAFVGVVLLVRLLPRPTA
jgi:hypothetical protein